MDIESHESAMLLKESSPRRRQGLALKLAVVLCGLALLVNLNGPTDTNIGVTFSSNKEEKKVTAAAEVSPRLPRTVNRACVPRTVNGTGQDVSRRGLQ